VLLKAEHIGTETIIFSLKGNPTKLTEGKKMEECICDAVFEGKCNGKVSAGGPCRHGTGHTEDYLICRVANCAKIWSKVKCIPVKQEPDWEV
jgi:hypothetical protein